MTYLNWVLDPLTRQLDASFLPSAVVYGEGKHVLSLNKADFEKCKWGKNKRVIEQYSPINNNKKKVVN